MSSAQVALAPIELKHYFYPHIHVEANRDALKDGPPEEQPWGQNIEQQVTVVSASEPSESGTYQVALQIRTAPREGYTTSYKLEVDIVGFFAINEDLADEQKESLLYRTAPAILYSSARDYILTLTMRGPFPYIVLPVFSFSHAKAVV